MKDRAIALLSGGVDSATALYAAGQEGYELFAMTFDYGQRCRAEITAARRIAAAACVVEHLVFPVDLARLGGSALTGTGKIPKGVMPARMRDAIPPTYVPARNLVFLSLALAWAESIGSANIFLGVNAVDYSGYPDCRPEFIREFQSVAGLATGMGVQGIPVRVHTPLIDLTKGEIVRMGASLGVDFSLTVSCYEPNKNGQACQQCESCLLRLRGFEQAGMKDPAAQGR